MIKIVLGNFNAKYEREPHYFPCTGKESLHSHSNDNGQQIISFATLNGLTVSRLCGNEVMKSLKENNVHYVDLDWEKVRNAAKKAMAYW